MSASLSAVEGRLLLSIVGALPLLDRALVYDWRQALLGSLPIVLCALGGTVVATWTISRGEIIDAGAVFGVAALALTAVEGYWSSRINPEGKLGGGLGVLLLLRSRLGGRTGTDLLSIVAHAALGLFVAAQLHFVVSACRSPIDGRARWAQPLAVTSTLVALAFATFFLPGLASTQSFPAFMIPVPLPSTLVGGSTSSSLSGSILQSLIQAALSAGTFASATSQSPIVLLAGVAAASSAIGVYEALRWSVTLVSLAVAVLSAGLVWVSWSTSSAPFVSLDQSPDPSNPSVQSKPLLDSSTALILYIGLVLAGIGAIAIGRSLTTSWQLFHSIALVEGPRFEQTLLVVVFNSAYYSVIPTIEELYKPFWPHIVYYGPLFNTTVRDPRVTLIDLDKGNFGYRALEHAVRDHPGFNNYLYTNDDLAINPYALATLDLQEFWRSRGFETGYDQVPLDGVADGDAWWAFRFHTTLRQDWSAAYAEIPEHYRQRAEAVSRSGTTTIFAGQNDFFNLPGRYAAEFLELLKPFSRHNVFHETVFHTILRFFDPTPALNMPDDASIWLWMDRREELEEELRPSRFALHPTKLSDQRVVGIVHRWLQASADFWRAPKSDRADGV